MTRVKICPQCGCTDITTPPAGLDLRMTYPDYCEKCGNRGTFPNIDVEDIKLFKKGLNKD